jgi:hypothetical protein
MHNLEGNACGLGTTTTTTLVAVEDVTAPTTFSYGGPIGSTPHSFRVDPAPEPDTSMGKKVISLLGAPAMEVLDHAPAFRVDRRLSITYCLGHGQPREWPHALSIAAWARGISAPLSKPTRARAVGR